MTEQELIKLIPNYPFEDGNILTYNDVNDICEAFLNTSTESDGAQIVDKLISIEYGELVSLVSNSGLTPGMQYRLTDYECTVTNDTNAKAINTGHFDIILVADDETTLNENVRFTHHEYDEYFAGCNLSTWKAKYSLTNDTNKFAWADDSPNGKGVIYWLKDEWNNECPYDFKNIQFKRVENSVDNWYYTFGTTNDKTITTIENLSVLNNIIESHYDSGSGLQTLNNNIFKGDSTFSNTLKLDCYNNTFNQNCVSNLFKGNFNNNTFTSTCQGNTFDIICENNIFNNNFLHNTFGIRCSGNVFNANSQNNVFGRQFSGNTINEKCLYNTFGNLCVSNVFNTPMLYNTFKNQIQGNIFGDYNYIIDGDSGVYGYWNNSFGNGFIYNTLHGNNYMGNIFNDSVKCNEFFVNYLRYSEFECCIKCVSLSCDIANHNAKMLRCIHVLNDVSGTFTSSNNGKLEGITYFELNKDGLLNVNIGDENKTNYTLYCGYDSQKNYVIKNILENNENGILSAPLITKILYDELKILKNDNSLIPGMQYRITDYVTTVNTSLGYVQSAYHVFDIILVADDESTLNENVRFTHNEDDGYFAGCNLSAWEGKYCLDNDTNKFAWADDTNGKGVIYWLKDEYNNECPYDFKNIQFKMDISSDVIPHYTFSVRLNDVNYDATVATNFGDDINGINHITHDNIIRPYTIDIDDLFENINNRKNISLQLNFNVFVITDIGNECICGNNFGINCHHNVFWASCINNTFGDYCHHNYIIETNNEPSYCNTFGKHCCHNTLPNGFKYNTFGNDCCNNILVSQSEYECENYYHNTFNNGVKRISGKNLRDFRHYLILDGVSDYILGDLTDNTYTNIIVGYDTTDGSQNIQEKRFKDI